MFALDVVDMRAYEVKRARNQMNQASLWFDVLPAASAGKERDPCELAFRYKGEYWGARAAGSYAGCRDIFGQHVDIS
jgi:hypothetical protein